MTTKCFAAWITLLKCAAGWRKTLTEGFDGARLQPHRASPIFCHPEGALAPRDLLFDPVRHDAQKVERIFAKGQTNAATDLSVGNRAKPQPGTDTEFV